MLFNKNLFLSAFICLSALFVPQSSFAEEKPEVLKNDLALVQKLSQQIDLNLEFTNTEGKLVKLSQYFETGKPVIITPVYFGCPRMCTLVLNGVTKFLSQSKLKLGSDFSILSVSFDHTNSPSLAAEKANNYYKTIGSSQIGTGNWHFLVGSETNVLDLMNQIGFHFKKDGDDFSHQAVIVILTSDGKISQYFQGIEYPEWDMRLALVNASEGKIGSFFEHAALFCFRFDPTKGRYTWAAFNFMRLVAILTLLSLTGLLLYLWRKDLSESKKS